MRLYSLRLQNFRQHADTAVDFGTGITGIIGPNGAGKSTLLEAIAWALYGNPAARGTRDSIRFLRAQPRSAVRVELDFELGGHRYRVVRGLTSAELYLDGAAQPIANSITGVTELLQRRIGMTRGEFFNTYFTGQKELNVMAAMGPSERARFLSRVLGYEKLRVAQELVRDRRKLLAAEVMGLRGAMPDPQEVARQLRDAQNAIRVARERVKAARELRATTERAVAELQPQWEQAQLERQRLQELLGELRLLEAEEAAQAREMERMERELRAAQAAAAELERLRGELAPLAGVRTECAELEALARDEGRRQTLAESERALTEELTRLREREERLQPAPELEREVTDALAATRAELDRIEQDVETRRTEWVRDRQEAETKRQALRQTYLDLKEQRDRLAALGPDGPCPTCTRPLGANFTAVLQDLDEKMETVEVDGRWFRDRLEQLADAPEPLRELEERRRKAAHDAGAQERKLAKCQAGVQELAQVRHDLELKVKRHALLQAELAALPTGYDAARHAERRAMLERLAPLESKAAQLGAQAERVPALVAEHARGVERLAATRQQAAALRERRATLDAPEERFAPLRLAYEEAVAAARGAELAAVGAEGEERSAAVALEGAEQAQSELQRTQAALDRLQRDRRLHDELDRAYTDLRTELNYALRPELSDIASSFLADLTDGRYTQLDLDDQYNVIVIEERTPKPVISGGEEDLANLVLRLAISQMIAERAGQAFSLLVLDEVFGSLDETRRHNVVELLRGLSDRFEQVVLITHIEGVRDAVDQVIEVRYDQATGASVVRQIDGETADEQAALPPADAPSRGAELFDDVAGLEIAG